MNDLLYKLILMMVSSILSQIIYLVIDAKYEITNKVDLKVRIKRVWKPSFCYCCVVMLILIVWSLSTYVVNMPSQVFFTLCGVFTGVGSSISQKMSIDSHV